MEKNIDKALYENVIRLILEDKEVSMNHIQRKFRISYHKACEIVDKMEEDGLVSKWEEGKKREVLIEDYNFETPPPAKVEQEIQSPDPVEYKINEEEYKKAVLLVLQNQKASPSFLQRKMIIGYVKASMFLDKMEQDGIVSVPEKGQRTVLISEQDYKNKN